MPVSNAVQIAVPASPPLPRLAVLSADQARSFATRELWVFRNVLVAASNDHVARSIAWCVRATRSDDAYARGDTQCGQTAREGPGSTLLESTGRIDTDSTDVD